MSQIEGDGNIAAEYGSEVHFKCRLDDPTDVVQVTWQRVSEDNHIENLASYSKRFGERVNDPYRGKINFTEASLHSTTISVKNLTWADESCYVCLFNAYPSGSKRHQACLKVQGVSQVKTEVYALPDEPKEKNIKVIFSCTATGKPAPRIQWEHLHHTREVEESRTSVWTNEDQTLTSSRNITLQLSPDQDGHVDCVINPGARGERRETFTREKTRNDGGINTFVITTITITIIMILFIAVGISLWLKRSKLQTRCDHDML